MAALQFYKGRLVEVSFCDTQHSCFKTHPRQLLTLSQDSLSIDINPVEC